MPTGVQAEAAGDRAPSPDAVCKGRGHTSETKPDSVLRSQLLRAPQRAQSPVGCG